MSVMTTMATMLPPGSLGGNSAASGSVSPSRASGTIGDAAATGECKSECKSEVKPAAGSDTKLCEFCCEPIAAKALRCRYCGATLNKVTKEESDLFVVVREEGEEVCGGLREKVMKVSVMVKDAKMKQKLNGYLHNNAEMYEKQPKLSAEELFGILPTLRVHTANFPDKSIDPLWPLINFLEKEFEDQAQKFAALTEQGLASFESLRHLFNRGQQFFGFVDDEPVGSVVANAQYQRSMLGVLFAITAEVIKSKGDQFFTQEHAFYVPSFRGTRKITELPVRPMTDAMMTLLRERGQHFRAVGTGCHFLEYTGAMSYQTRFFRTSWNATGRVMVDGISFNKSNPDYAAFCSNNGRRFGGNNNDDTALKTIGDDSLYKTWPSVGGFSFRTKKWGELLVDKCQPVVFDDLAFSRLVLPADKKSLIHSLIVHTGAAFSDIISGKGAGSIFLLHGPPGTGKTLTAEATAELLHRPLYSVSVGELGVNTKTLEAALRDILEIAAVWNAVVLIDEADIFLERRTDNDIKRNALVGIFLRLLEYHQGIIFLTTNRVRNFDEAFHSRISVALKYPELDRLSRRKIWTNLLEAAKLSDMPIEALSMHDINGRQIRTTIRLAQALARSENVPVSMAHFERTISVATQFQHDLIDLRKEADALARVPPPSPAAAPAAAVAVIGSDTMEKTSRRKLAQSMAANRESLALIVAFMALLLFMFFRC